MLPTLLSLLKGLPAEQQGDELHVPMNDGRTVIAEATNGGAPYVVAVVSGEDGSAASVAYAGGEPLTCDDEKTAAEAVRACYSGQAVSA